MDAYSDNLGAVFLLLVSRRQNFEEAIGMLSNGFTGWWRYMGAKEEKVRKERKGIKENKQNEKKERKVRKNKEEQDKTRKIEEEIGEVTKRNGKGMGRDGMEENGNEVKGKRRGRGVGNGRMAKDENGKGKRRDPKRDGEG